ncbi:MAG: ribonuclease P protein component [Paracoccaceae bacterium]
MTPPEAPAHGQTGPDAASPPAVSVRLEVLARRADFLRAAQARRQGTGGFLVQARARREGEAAPDLIRVGFTCSKKVGNAVIRNRAKRRLRALARAILPAEGRPGWDYVLVGRPETTVSRDFAQMLADLSRALAQIHAKP